MPKYGNFETWPVSRKPLPVEQKSAQFWPPGVEREYICNFWNFGQWLSFMPKYYGNFENRPVSLKPLPVEQQYAQFRSLGVEGGYIHVQILTLWPMAKFLAKYGNFENRPISRKPLPVEQKKAQFWPLGKGVYLEFWQMAKLVLKQSAKAHGPIVFFFLFDIRNIL